MTTIRPAKEFIGPGSRVRSSIENRYRNSISRINLRKIKKNPDDLRFPQAKSSGKNVRTKRYFITLRRLVEKVRTIPFARLQAGRYLRGIYQRTIRLPIGRGPLEIVNIRQGTGFCNSDWKKKISWCLSGFKKWNRKKTVDRKMEPGYRNRDILLEKKFNYRFGRNG